MFFSAVAVPQTPVWIALKFVQNRAPVLSRCAKRQRGGSPLAELLPVQEIHLTWGAEQLGSGSKLAAALALSDAGGSHSAYSAKGV